MESIAFFIAYVLVILFSIVLHEVAHGVAAHSLGDPTAKNLGRLTLNPIKHLDLFGSIILPVMTYWAGGFIFGYAKPVPYNPLYLNDQKYGPAKVAVAGPLTNIAIAVLFSLVLRFAPAGVFSFAAWELIAYIVFINLLLAIFNLVPIPPLDGHWILLTFLPEKYYRWKQLFQQFGIFLFVIFVLFLFPLLLPVVEFCFRLLTGSPLGG
ncbi:MAG: Peptidase M50 [Parcubacteria group bacterium GW2011_GWB1_48_6]|nr:MAG: Peptidase M50 [Parcubacteria group bacterium GW2011_GWB1_48_6]